MYLLPPCPGSHDAMDTVMRDVQSSSYMTSIPMLYVNCRNAWGLQSDGGPGHRQLISSLCDTLCDIAPRELPIGRKHRRQLVRLCPVCKCVPAVRLDKV